MNSIIYFGRCCNSYRNNKYRYFQFIWSNAGVFYVIDKNRYNFSSKIAYQLEIVILTHSYKITRFYSYFVNNWVLHFIITLFIKIFNHFKNILKIHNYSIITIHLNGEIYALFENKIDKLRQSSHNTISL